MQRRAGQRAEMHHGDDRLAVAENASEISGHFLPA
jgi:hypothetical protein